MTEVCNFDQAGNYAWAIAVIGVAFAIAWVRVERWRAVGDKTNEPRIHPLPTEAHT